MIAKEAKGFVYCVSSLGVTGVPSEIKTDVAKMVEMVKEVDPTADIGVVLHAGDVVTEQFIEQMKSLKTGLNTVFFSHYARKITPVVLERCKEEQIQLVARDIKNIQSLYALDLYYRAAFADGF